MSKNIEIFKNQEFGQIRTLLISEEPWFVGKDVADALGYVNSRDAIQKHVEEVDKGASQITTPFGMQNMTIINESGLYALIFGSKLESAKRFKHWVTSEVLPEIRKTGTYSATPEIQKTISARELAAILKRKQCKVCYRIDGILKQHPEYRMEFLLDTFTNIQGRTFRTYNLTEKGLRIFVRALEQDGNRNSVNTVKGIQQIKSLSSVDSGRTFGSDTSEVSLSTHIALKEWKKAEAALEMFEQCYLGADYSTFDKEERERFDSALCLLHDQVKLAVTEAQEGVIA